MRELDELTPEQRQVYDYVHGKCGLIPKTVVEIAADMGVKVQWVSPKIKKLVEMDLIKKSGSSYERWSVGTAPGGWVH